MRKIFAVLLIAGIMLNAIGILNVRASSGGNPGAIWTTRADCGDITQDVNHYERGESVYINGANFDPGIYNWSIEGQPGNASGDPNQIVASGTVNVGDSGAFCFAAYTVAADDWGEYSVKVGNKGDNYRVNVPIPTSIPPTATQPCPTATQPSPTETQPSPTETQPSPTATLPGPTETQPSPTATLPGPTATLPGPTETQPGPTETQPSPTATLPGPTTEPKTAASGGGFPFFQFGIPAMMIGILGLIKTRKR